MRNDFDDFQEKLITIPERSQDNFEYTTHIILECESCNNVLNSENIKTLH